MNLPIISAYTEATTAASVGVKMPPYIPPRMMSGTSRAQKASLKARPSGILFCEIG